MKAHKIFFILALLLILTVNSAFAQKSREDFKVLAQGGQSEVEKPFIFVARDAKTYEVLRSLVRDLPEVNTLDFNENAVVAAFAGTKPTAGYGVTIRKTSQTNMIDLVSPPKSAMVAQVITQSFKIVVIPVDKDKALPLDSGANWANAMQNYRVTSGNFEFAGGIAGRNTKFTANGGISIWTHGDYVTIFLNLRGMKNQKNRRLMEYASGIIKNGKLEFSRLDAGSFVNNPRPPFGVSGTLNGRNLFLDFKSLPTRFADGFTGSGKVGAVKVR